MERSPFQLRLTSTCHLQHLHRSEFIWAHWSHNELSSSSLALHSLVFKQYKREKTGPVFAVFTLKAIVKFTSNMVDYSFQEHNADWLIPILTASVL